MKPLSSEEIEIIRKMRQEGRTDKEIAFMLVRHDCGFEKLTDAYARSK